MEYWKTSIWLIGLSLPELGITSVTVPTDRLERDSVASNLKGNIIQKGMLVEV